MPEALAVETLSSPAARVRHEPGLEPQGKGCVGVSTPVTRPRLCTLVSVVLTCGVLAGCSDGESRPEADPPATSASATPSASADLPCVPGIEPFSGPAVERFGADAVMAAYCAVADLSRETAFTNLLVPGPHKVRDFALVRPWLSPGGRRTWDADVRAALATGDAAAESRVDALTLHDVRRVPDGYLLADDPPPAFGTTVGPANASVRGSRLTLELDVSTGLVLERRGEPDGSHSLWPWTKRMTVTMVQRGDQWLVEDWRATWSQGQVRLASG